MNPVPRNTQIGSYIAKDEYITFGNKELGDNLDSSIHTAHIIFGLQSTIQPLQPLTGAMVFYSFRCY